MATWRIPYHCSAVQYTQYLVLEPDGTGSNLLIGKVELPSNASRPC